MRLDLDWVDLFMEAGMPVQQQMSSFAKRLGGRVAAANAEHRDKPVDTGNRRLPPGIREGIAKLQFMYTKEQDRDDGKTPKGETFFRASASVLGYMENGALLENFKGEKIAGMVTQQTIPLCDIPAKGEGRAKSFSENWFDFQNLFKLLGVNAPPYGPQDDPNGAKTEAYYFSAMKALTDPVRLREKPIYVSFSTRGWTPPKKPGQVKENEEMVFETWHGMVEVPKTISSFDPAAGVKDAPPPPPPSNGQPTHLHQAPPTHMVLNSQNTAAPLDLGDEVAALIESAMNDPDGETPEGKEAQSRLEELAWAAGWSKEQTAGAPDWGAVGDMALNKPTDSAAAAADPNGPADAPAVTVGSRWMFAKRTKDGAKLKNNKGEEFPSQEVEVTSVDQANRTCTVKNAKDGKDVADIRTKKPVEVKWDWLETLPF